MFFYDFFVHRTKQQDGRVDGHGWTDWSVLDWILNKWVPLCRWINENTSARQERQSSSSADNEKVTPKLHASCRESSPRLKHLRCKYCKHVCRCTNQGALVLTCATAASSSKLLFLPDECEDKSIVQTSDSPLAGPSSIILQPCWDWQIHTNTHWHTVTGATKRPPILKSKTFSPQHTCNISICQSVCMVFWFSPAGWSTSYLFILHRWVAPTNMGHNVLWQGLTPPILQEVCLK